LSRRKKPANEKEQKILKGSRRQQRVPGRKTEATFHGQQNFRPKARENRRDQKKKTSKIAGDYSAENKSVQKFLRGDREKVDVRARERSNMQYVQKKKKRKKKDHNVGKSAIPTKVCRKK